MDKRTVYGVLRVPDAIVSRYDKSIDCSLNTPCKYFADPKRRCVGCEARVLVDPAALAKVEADAAKAAELEAAIAKKDACLNAINEGILNRFMTPSDIRTDEQLLAMSKACEDAISLTPASVAEAVEDARVGKAVVEWHGRLQENVEKVQPKGSMRIGYCRAANEIKQVIKKAREGKLFVQFF